MRLSRWFTMHGPALTAALLASLAITSLFLSTSNQNALTRISHTSQVQRAISKLSGSLTDVIVAERNFHLTGNKAYLADRLSTHKTAIDQFRVTSTLIEDNAKQTLLFAELRPLIDQRFATEQILIDTHLAGELGGERISPLALRAQGEMASVRSKIQEVEDVEAQLFDERTSSAVSALRAFAISVALGALAVALALLLWWRQSQQAIKVLASSNSRLSLSLIELEKADDQIRHMHKMEAIGQLTGGLAHDFNNMLAVVISSLSLAQKRLAKGSANVDTLVQGALAGAHRAAILTSRLLAFSRQQPLSPQTVNVNRIAGGMSELITRTLGDHIRVETVLAGGLWPTDVDVSQMENALLNLCVNARDAMPEGGSVTIETSNAHLDDSYARQNIGVIPGQYVLIAVTDTGTGMPAEVVARAFEPFFTTKGVGKGSGLGLSQVFGFAKQSGGHLKIYSEIAQGTTIKIYFPRSFATKADIQAATRDQFIETQEMRRGNPSQIILVVEDENSVRALTSMTLRELGYTVVHAEDAVSALQQLDVHPEIELLFTDIVMPGMNGRKLADEAVLRRPKLKVLFTTGFTRNAVVHGGVLDAGVNFIAKPFTIEQIAAKVAKVIDIAAVPA